ncbi:hypothetical protein [Actinomadura sp. 9N407]|uniref:hypothetical protein n=1 Tax=Actinomadura sp. 9N407 TaxID=3375154 RepID=UPI0037914B22
MHLCGLGFEAEVGLEAWMQDVAVSLPPAALTSRLGKVRLRLERDVIEDGRLAVSETATNALRYGRAPGDRPPTAPELWIWARTVPSAQLVVSLFGCARISYPHASGAGLLDEYSKGLGLLGEFTAEWGSAPSRSRLAERAVLGKTVWFALPLPGTWPGLGHRVHPGTAAQCLLLALMKRGFPGTLSSDDRGISVLELPGLNVWVHRKNFCWRDGPSSCVRRPLIDLQETAEHLVRDLLGSPARTS